MRTGHEFDCLCRPCLALVRASINRRLSFEDTLEHYLVLALIDEVERLRGEA